MTAVELIAWNLRRLRVAKGLSQEALAVDATVDRTYVSRLERELENPSVNVLERLAHALGADIAELFTRPAQEGRTLPLLRSGRKPGSKR